MFLVSISAVQEFNKANLQQEKESSSSGAYSRNPSHPHVVLGLPANPAPNHQEYQQSYRQTYPHSPLHPSTFLRQSRLQPAHQAQLRKDAPAIFPPAANVQDTLT